MKIVVDNKIKFLRGAFDTVADVVEAEGRDITPEMVRDADALVIRTRTRCDANLLEGSTVKAIFTATIGFDHIDTAYCEAHNIHWQNAPGCNAASVQQYIFSALARLHTDCGMTLREQTIAIVGVGHVGRLVEEWARKMQMNVLLVDPLRAEAEGTEAFTDYAEALQKADIVTYHTPLTRDGQHPTYHLLSHRELHLLKRGATVINTSRGEVTDTQALISGLTDGTIGHAIVDVWEGEPNISVELVERAFIATPHIAGYSADSKRNASQMSVDALTRHFGICHPWQAAPLTEPAQTEVSIPQGCDTEEAACRMMLATYDPMTDSRALRADLSQFEYLRGNYPLRREIGAYHLQADAAHANYLKTFGIR